MKCPGQDTQFWDANAIYECPCPKCNTMVEFFKDDTTRKCGRCGHRFVNPKMDFGCAAYCQFAEQCLGDLPAEVVAQKEDLLKDRVAVAVKRHLKNNFKRIGRAARRARHAQAICNIEQGNLASVLMAAYLWELDDAEPFVCETSQARGILADLNAPDPLISKVCAIIGNLSASNGNAADQRITADAAQLTDLEDEIKKSDMDHAFIEERIVKELQTHGGQTHARKVLLERSQPS